MPAVPYAGGAFTDVGWDFLALPDMIVGKSYLGVPGGQLTGASVKGIILAKVVGVKGTKVSPANRPSFYKFAQTFESGDSEALLQTQVASWVKYPQQPPSWFAA